MIVPLPLFLTLANACAPQVASETLQAVVRVESGFDALAIGVNGAPGLRARAKTAQEAGATARALIRQGRSVDLGLGQINSANLNRLGLSIEAAFDPCRNLTAAAQILSEGYAKARPRHADDQAALRAALSLYNTGHETRGLKNGYVAKVLAAAPSAPARPAAAAAALPVPPWDVFGHAHAAETFFITVSAPAASEAGDLP